MLKVIITPDAVEFLGLLSNPVKCDALSNAMSLIDTWREDDLFHEDEQPDKCKVASITARLLAKCIPLRSLYYAGWANESNDPDNDRYWTVFSFLTEEEQDLWVNGLWEYDDAPTTKDREPLSLEQIAERFEMPELTNDGETLNHPVSEGSLGLELIDDDETTYFMIEYSPSDVVLEIDFVEPMPKDTK